MTKNDKHIKKRRQHWVPKFYLEYFSVPETQDSPSPKVWVLDRKEGEPFIVSIKNIALKSYLYSPTDKEGARNYDTEDELANVEYLASQMWPIISTNYFDIIESPYRKYLALFMSILHLRHPKNIQIHKDIHKSFVDIGDAALKGENGDPLLNKLEVNGQVYDFDPSDFFEYKNANHSDIQKMFVDSIKHNAVELAEILLKKRWSIVVSDKPVFITSDEPVSMFHKDKEKFGFGTHGTTVLFPISPHRILVLDDLDQPAGQYYSLQQGDEALYNYVTWIHAEKFMISHRHTDEVLFEFYKGNLIDGD